ncbi:hypothetical protein EDB81DRAFT_781134 [Dactylonectria macrodidyma]|uniref:Uncharacterized protein n=1 Tax=Dactylonectria macrodidyma TaxID=307937 RepID=A0A9P9FL01_9HYPO|nr:hypothetical protein EDB81DRAFT_781134 [Dactylonectria macrodidyma]
MSRSSSTLMRIEAQLLSFFSSSFAQLFVSSAPQHPRCKRFHIGCLNQWAQSRRRQVHRQLACSGVASTKASQLGSRSTAPVPGFGALSVVHKMTAASARDRPCWWHCGSR